MKKTPIKLSEIFMLLENQVSVNNDVVEVFDGVDNVEFEELGFAPGQLEELPVFKIKSVTAVEWNRKAFNTNKQTFISIFQRDPYSDEEVQSWVLSFVNKENHIAGNDAASMII